MVSRCRPDSPETRKIALLAETRRHLVEDRKRLVQRLTDALKQYRRRAQRLALRQI